MRKTVAVGVLVVLVAVAIFPVAANPIGLPPERDVVLDRLIYLVTFIVGVTIFSLAAFGLSKLFRKSKFFSIFKN